jgi:four helix bundle protein
MAAFRRFEDIIAWQLGVQLRDRIFDLTGACKRIDDDFREQIRDSASSVPRNIAEGFAKFNPGDFGRFVAIARGSLGETQNHLRHGLRERFWTSEQFDEMWRVSCRAVRATARLHAYLRAQSSRGSRRQSSSTTRT